jgi:putative nucleotidyltransferase with HDIG domain
MNAKTVEELKNWFASYVQTFKLVDAISLRNIVLKEKHTDLVCKGILDIGGKLGLSDNDLRLAEVIALFHDIGRFEQYARYHTFVDHKSVDHAELGGEILQEFGVLNKLDESTRYLILRTIAYHNRAALPQEETEICLFFTKLLRDADKLDIWRIVIDHYQQNGDERNGATELGLPDTPGISDDVYKDLMEGRIVESAHLKNLNDFKLLQLGWIYDINFTPAFRYIQEKGFLTQIRDVLPDIKEVEEVYSAVNSYLNEHIVKRVNESYWQA